MHARSTIIVMLALLTLTSVTISTLYPLAPYFYVQTVSVSYSGTSDIYYKPTMSLQGITTNNSINIMYRNFSVSWRQDIVQSYASGLSLFNYIANTQNNFLSYVIELCDIQRTYGKLCFENHRGAEILYLTFNLIIITEQHDYIDLFGISDSFKVLNSNSISRPNEQYFLATSKRVYFQATTDWIKVDMVQWFTMKPVTINKQYLNPVCSIQELSSSIKIKLSSLAIYANSYDRFKLVFLVFAPFKILPNFFYARKSQILSLVSPLTALYNNFGIATQLQGVANGYHCIFSMLQHDISPLNSQMYAYFVFNSTFNITNLNYSYSNPPPLNYTVEHWVTCVLQCPPNYFYINPLSNSKCLRCIDYLDYCSDCINDKTCINCVATATLSGNNITCMPCTQIHYLCLTCSNYTYCQKCKLGMMINGNCTTVVGCIQTYKGNLTNYNSNCARCDQTNFYFEPINKTCICKVGHLVGDLCIDVSGCISAITVNNQVQCIYCNTTAKYYYDLPTKTCECISGYAKNVYGLCVEICGDGIIFDSDCDDGNTGSGDGCSSTCQIEISYKCYGMPSVCRFYGKYLNASVVDIQKVPYRNTGIFKFKFSSVLESWHKLNISKYFSFHCDTIQHKVLSWSEQDGQITTYVDYFEDFQQAQARVNFTFDQFYFNHPSFEITFLVQSRGSKLLIYGKQRQTQPATRYILIAVSYFSVFALLFCSYFNKMAGVELIHVLQTIYYLHFTFANYSSYETDYQRMSIVSGKHFFSGQSINFMTDKAYQILKFQPYYTDLLVIVSFALLVCISLVIAITQLILKYKQFARKQTILKITKSIRDYFLFPLSMALTIPVFLSFHSYHMYSGSQQSSLMSFQSRMFFLFLIVIVCAFFYNAFVFLLAKNGIVKKHTQTHLYKEHYEQCYKLVFLIYLIILLWSITQKSNTACIFILIFWGILMNVYISVRPYLSSIDNFGTFYNCLVMCIFSLYLTLRNKTSLYDEQQNKLAFNFFVTYLLLVSAIITLIRIIRMVIIKYRKSCRTRQPKKPLKIQFNNNVENNDFKTMISHTQSTYPKSTLQNQHLLKYCQNGQQNHRERMSSEQNSEIKAVINRYAEKFRKKYKNKINLQRKGG